MLSAMEYPHWLMVAGAVLVASGFVASYFSKTTLSRSKMIIWSKKSPRPGSAPS
jgi:hypothetical protein